MLGLINELRASLRLRAGLALILAIFGLYGLLEWRDAGQARLAQYRQLSGQAARLGNQSAQALWPERAAQAKAALAVVQQRPWRNTSFGLAQAEFQDWVYTLLRQVDAKNFSVKLSDGDVGFAAAKSAAANEAPNPTAGLKQLRARIDLNFDPPVLLALLAAVNAAEHQVIVDSLSIKSLRAGLDLSVWYRLQPDPAAPSAKPSSAAPTR
jgi:hypothetical protein